MSSRKATEGWRKGARAPAHPTRTDTARIDAKRIDTNEMERAMEQEKGGEVEASPKGVLGAAMAESKA